MVEPEQLRHARSKHKAYLSRVLDASINIGLVNEKAE